MGRTKGKHLHTAAKALMKKFPDMFTESFNENKKKLASMDVLRQSKGERNKLAGELGKSMQKKKRAAKD